MLSKQEGLSLGFAGVAAIVLYYILAQVYTYLFVLLVLYGGYRIIQVQVEDTIEVVGKSVLVTGCDTGMSQGWGLGVGVL